MLGEDRRGVSARSMRLVCAMVISAAGGVCLLLGGGAPLDEGSSGFFQASLLNVVGFVLLAAAIGVLNAGRLSRKWLLGINILYVTISVAAVALSLSTSMGFISDMQDRHEQSRLRQENARHQWAFQQLVTEECLGNFEPRCATLRRVTRDLATGATLASPEEIALACVRDPTPLADNPDVADWLRSGCEWLRYRRSTWTPDWSDVDATAVGMRQYMITLILAIVTAFNALASVLSLLPNRLDRRISLSEPGH